MSYQGQNEACEAAVPFEESGDESTPGFLVPEDLGLVGEQQPIRHLMDLSRLTLAQLPPEDDARKLLEDDVRVVDLTAVKSLEKRSCGSKIPEDR